MITLKTADNALKSAYLDVVSEQLNFKSDPFLAKIKQSSDYVYGKDVRQVIHYGVNGGVGVGDEDGELPKSGENLYDQIAVPLKNLYGTIEISDKAVRASENNTGAFVNLLNAEMEGLIKASTMNLSRMLMSDPNSPIASVEGHVGDKIKVSAIYPFVEGMTIDVYYADQLQEAGVRVTDVNYTDSTIKLKSENGAAVESEFYLPGAKGKGITGLGAIFNLYKDLYGLKRSEHAWLNPQVINCGGEITEMKIQQAIDFVQDTYGGSIDMIICSSGVRRALVEHLSSYRRNVDFMEVTGGFKAVSFNGIPVIASPYAEKRSMYLINSKDFTLHQLCDWKWLENEDGKVLKQVADKPVYKATLVKYAELICSRPCAQVLLQNINEK